MQNWILIFFRSLINKISNGIILAEPGAAFLERWISSYVTLETIKHKTFSYWGLVVPYQLYETSPRDELHLELTSMNRPNPFQDGLNSTTSENYDLSENFFLHIHPQVFPLTGNRRLYAAREHLLRTMDNTYGAAARVAMFGSSDLVFLKGETPFGRKPTKRVVDDAPSSGYSFDGGGVLQKILERFGNKKFSDFSES